MTTPQQQTVVPLVVAKPSLNLCRLPKEITDRSDKRSWDLHKEEIVISDEETSTSKSSSSKRAHQAHGGGPSSGNNGDSASSKGMNTTKPNPSASGKLKVRKLSSRPLTRWVLETGSQVLHGQNQGTATDSSSAYILLSLEQQSQGKPIMKAINVQDIITFYRAGDQTSQAAGLEGKRGITGTLTQATSYIHNLSI